MERNLTLDLYAITDAPIVLGAEDADLRPYIEQLNATGKADVTAIRTATSRLRDYYYYHYGQRYMGGGRWEAYLRNFKTKEERDSEERRQKRIRRDEKLFDAFDFVNQFIKIFLIW